MTLHEEQQRVQKSVSHSLAYMREDPWLAQRVLANVKGEEPVKKRISTVFILSVILALALIGTAYALSSSLVAEFFGLHWNRELGESLQEGKIAQVGESVTIGDVVFTLDEIVYRERTLYGVGTARPVRENDVIVPMDIADLADMEFESFSEKASEFIEKAKATGGRLLTTYCMPQKIGVDGGTMLMPGCIGYYDICNPDGSLIFAFEASDGFAVNEGTSYQILMESHVRQLDDNGATHEETALHGEWTVSCIPVVMVEPTPQAANQPVTIENREDCELITPAAYNETGTLPIYQAVETDFTTIVDPEWFNRTGIVSGVGTEEIRFADHAILNLSKEGLFYYEFTDENYAEAPSSIIVDRLWVRNWSGHRGEFALDKTELTGITLDEARDAAETMMTRLGIDGNQYACEEALDLSLERIQEMGAIWEQAIADGNLLVDDDYQPYNYSAIPASEEGYYLKYSPLGVDTTVAGGRYGVAFYITGRGIEYASVRNPFVCGGIVSTPASLITPETAVSRLTEELGRSLPDYSKEIKSIQRIALTYETIRAENKADGMVFSPVWMIMYQDESAVRQDASCYALINAVDGALISASFN